jgi:hypothetical protein
MLSVVMAADGAERVVVATLSALVAGAAAGVVRDVVLVAGRPSELLDRIADVSGCTLLQVEGTRGEALAAGARAAKSDWLMFLSPGAVPENGWIDEVGDFVTHSTLRDGAVRAALFGVRQTSPYSLAAIRAAIVGAMSPSPDQGLIISRAHYREIGGHAPAARDPERKLVARIPRARRVTLRSRILL